MGPKRTKTDNVVGKLVHTFLLPVEKSNLPIQYEDLNVPLRYGGTRKLKLEVVNNHNIKLPRWAPNTEIKVKLPNRVRGECLSGELYYKNTQGRKEMIREKFEDYTTISWEENCDYFSPQSELTLDIKILSANAPRADPEKKSTTKVVIGELVHTFLLSMEKAHLTSRYEDLHVPLKHGGMRRVQLEVRRTNGMRMDLMGPGPPYCRPITPMGGPGVPRCHNDAKEIKVTLLDDVMGEAMEEISAELYFEIAPGHKKMIQGKGPFFPGKFKTWLAYQNDIPPNLELTVSIQIRSWETPDDNIENPEDMQKKAALALREDYATLRRSLFMSDVTIVCEGERFPAHKLILSARSKVFAAMFSQKIRIEEQQQEVDIKVLDMLTMERLLTFLYDATLAEDIPFEEYVKLHKAANEYQVPSLADACVVMLEKRVNQGNAISGAIFASLNKIPKLKNEAIRAIANTGAALSSMEGYEELRGYPDLLIEIVDYGKNNLVAPNNTPPSKMAYGSRGQSNGPMMGPGGPMGPNGPTGGPGQPIRGPGGPTWWYEEGPGGPMGGSRGPMDPGGPNQMGQMGQGGPMQPGIRPMGQMGQPMNN